VVGLFLGLGWIFFLCRLYVRTSITKNFGVDDLLLVAAAALFTTTGVCIIFGVKYGLGKHHSETEPEVYAQGMKFSYLSELFYILTTLFIRLSISMSLIRISVIATYKIIIYSIIAVVIVFSIAYFFILVFQCSPVDLFWRQFNDGRLGTCVNVDLVEGSTITHSVISFVADWVLGLLPISLIWNLRLKLTTKISLAAILGLALLAGVATMIRIPYIRILAKEPYEYLLSLAPVAVWAMAEAGLGMIAASAYTLRPLFRSVQSAIHSSSKKRSVAQDMQHSVQAQDTSSSHDTSPRGNLSHPPSMVSVQSQQGQCHEI